jgi:hypothetical protein
MQKKHSEIGKKSNKKSKKAFSELGKKSNTHPTFHITKKKWHLSTQNSVVAIFCKFQNSGASLNDFVFSNPYI